MARIVFDLDGTLVDSAPTIAAAGNVLLAELGREPVAVATLTGFVGHGMAVLVERLLDHTGGVPGGAVGPHLSRYRAIYGADPVTGTELYPGVADALARLREAGHGLAVCAQKPSAPALQILRELGLMPPVTGFAGGDSIDVLKPDPRMLWHAADQLAPGPTVLVGVSATDAATAQAAGVPFLLHGAGYGRGEIPARAVFRDFVDLPAMVAALPELCVPA
jgi:phosphoglycolate phosphatase